MTISAPKSFLAITDLCLVIGPSVPDKNPDLLNLRALGCPEYPVKWKGVAPWLDEELCDLMAKPHVRQMLFVVNEVSAFETGLTLMALQKGYEVFVTLTGLSTISDTRLHRLRASSANICVLTKLLKKFVWFYKFAPKFFNRIDTIREFYFWAPCGWHRNRARVNRALPAPSLGPSGFDPALSFASAGAHLCTFE